MQDPETLLIIYTFPALYFLILLIPSSMIYDFGIFFLAYLRGVGPSPLIVLELVYDYIAFMAFYIRILVQAVRLLLMIFTYASLHDFVLYYSIDPQ